MWYFVRIRTLWRSSFLDLIGLGACGSFQRVAVSCASHAWFLSKVVADVVTFTVHLFSLRLKSAMIPFILNYNSTCITMIMTTFMFIPILNYLMLASH